MSLVRWAFNWMATIFMSGLAICVALLAVGMIFRTFYRIWSF